MFRKALTLLLIFSLAVNFAFAGVWAYHRFYIRNQMRKRHWDDDKRHRDWRRDHDRERSKKDGFERKLPRLMAHDKEHWKKVGKVRHALMGQHEKLFELLSEEETDRTAVNECLSKIADLRAEMQKLIVDHVLSVKKKLGPEESRKLMHFLRRKALDPGGARRPRYGPGHGPDRDHPRDHKDWGKSGLQPMPFYGWDFGLFCWEAR